MKYHLLVVFTVLSLVAEGQNSFPGSGNVGINLGSSSSQNKLQIGPNTQGWNGNDLVVSNSSGSLAFFSDGGESYIYGTHGISIRPGYGTYAMFAATSGYVGYGTTSPLSRIHVNSSIERESFRLYKNGNTSNYLSIWQGSGGAALDPIGTGKLYLGYDVGTDVYMNGKLGIGTSTPNAELQIPNGEIVVGGPASAVPSLNSSLFVLSKDNSSTTFPFYVGQQGGSDLFWVRGSGDGYFMTGLGIGTTSSQGLQVNAALSSEASTGVSNVRIGVLGTPRIILDHSGGTPFEIDNSSGRFRIFTPGVERFTITSAGQVGIGTVSPDAKLAVKGQIHAEEVKVDLSVPVPDYVFDKEYNLLSLEEIKSYIEANKHLPEVPSAKEIEANGINLGEMNLMLLKKVEELTLYIIKQQDVIRAAYEANTSLEQRVSRLEENKE